MYIIEVCRVRKRVTPGGFWFLLPDRGADAKVAPVSESLACSFYSGFAYDAATQVHPLLPTASGGLYFTVATALPTKLHFLVTKIRACPSLPLPFPSPCAGPIAPITPMALPWRCLLNRSVPFPALER